jgi:hypothetical protein
MGMSFSAETPVLYIKLGKEGGWESECLRDNIIRFGFESGSNARFPLCINKQWDALAKLIQTTKAKSTATRSRNETQRFFEDDGSTIWITFVGQSLYWGQLAAGVPQSHPDGVTVYRPILGGWRSNDLKNEPLTKDRLSGALTKMAAYRGTSCNVDEREYVIRRINGEKTPQIERALQALEQMRISVLELIKLLGPRDFETLVDLVFSTSGWRRLGTVGGPQKTLDLDLILPSTGERAFVQVKSETTSAQLKGYVVTFNEPGPFDRMFYVFHSGSAKTEDPRVTVVDPEKLARLVLDAGLVNWLIRKVA